MRHHSGSANRARKFYRQRTILIEGQKVTIIVSNKTKNANLVGYNFLVTTFFCRHKREVTKGFVETAFIENAFSIAEMKATIVLEDF